MSTYRFTSLGKGFDVYIYVHKIDKRFLPLRVHVCLQVGSGPEEKWLSKYTLTHVFSLTRWISLILQHGYMYILKIDS